MRRVFLLLLLSLVSMMSIVSPCLAAPAPAQLHETGLFAPGAPDRIHPRALAFTPAHALWSDAAEKRRWILLPPGTSIDARDPDAWRFPPGTKLWKEFAHGSRVETRYMALGNDGRWTFASYVWARDGLSAALAPATGQRLVLDDAPFGRYDIPSQPDCLNCHAGARAPVLGFGALQLGEWVPELMRRGLLRHAPAAWRSVPPQIAAASEAERAARGYLHANCGHCHHARGVPVPLVLAQDVAGMSSASAPTAAQLTTALRRMATREPMSQMPPLGTRIADPHGLALVRAWLELQAPTLPTPPQKEPPP